MQDCELFNVCSTEKKRSVVIICVYLAISDKGGVISMRKEVIMISVHKTRNKERINVFLKESEKEVQCGQEIQFHKLF